MGFDFSFLQVVAKIVHFGNVGDQIGFALRHGLPSWHTFYFP